VEDHFFALAPFHGRSSQVTNKPDFLNDKETCARQCRFIATGTSRELLPPRKRSNYPRLLPVQAHPRGFALKLVFGAYVADLHWAGKWSIVQA
jgi:hypothetical protein